tara:strand:- start:81 stop:749 length:669 start_codon:yes stop_codon:yes gene_type:complete
MRKTIQLNIILNLFCLLITSQYIYGQDENQSWTKITFEKKLPYSLKFEFSQGLRLKEELSVINLAFFEGAISYKTSKGFKVDIPYRYTIFEDKIKHRLSFGASYQYTIKPIALKYRIKYYRLYEEGESISEDGEAFGDLVRNKFTIRYKMNKKITPYISGELFYLYNTDTNPFDEYRTSLGIELDLPGKNSINFFYTLKKESVSSSNPNEISIVGFSCNTKL